jgi:hypothetical protein
MLEFSDLNGDEYLYHYTSEYIVSEKICSNDLLQIGNIKNTNDPKEKNIPSIRLEYFVSALQCEFESIMESIYEELKKYKIVCFCKDAIIDSRLVRGYNKPRMWAQYANKHRGCCLVLSRVEFEKTLAECNLEYFIGKDISYNNYIEKPSFILDDNQNIEEKIKIFVRENIDWFLFSKNIDWQSENEKRYIVYSDNEKEFVNISNSLIAIVFGSETPYHNFKGIIEHFDYIETTRLHWSNGIPSYTSIYSSYEDYLYKQLGFKFLPYLNHIVEPELYEIDENIPYLINIIKTNKIVSEEEIEFIDRVNNCINKKDNDGIGIVYELLEKIKKYHK